MSNAALQILLLDHANRIASDLSRRRGRRPEVENSRTAGTSKADILIEFQFVVDIDAAYFPSLAFNLPAFGNVIAQK
jgi:hypothetical protein